MVWLMPSWSLVVWMAEVIPWPQKMSSILPTAWTMRPAALRLSSRVGWGGVTEKSCRLAVRTKFPGWPTNGRAITRLTSCAPRNR